MRGRTPGSKTHCSYCFGIGHTKRTCPSLTNKINSLPEDSKDRQYYQRKQGTCKYCGKQDGHNRAGCQTLKNDLQQYSQLNNQFRTDIVNYLNSNGIVTGNCFEYEGQLNLRDIYISGKKLYVNEYVTGYGGEVTSIKYRCFLQVEKINYNNIDLYELFFHNIQKNVVKTKVLSYYVIEDNDYLLYIKHSADHKEKYNEIIQNINDKITQQLKEYRYGSADLTKEFFLQIPKEIYKKYIHMTDNRVERYEINNIKTYDCYTYNLNYWTNNNSITAWLHDKDDITVKTDIPELTTEDYKDHSPLFNDRYRNRQKYLRNNDFLSILGITGNAV